MLMYISSLQVEKFRMELETKDREKEALKSHKKESEKMMVELNMKLESVSSFSC